MQSSIALQDVQGLPFRLALNDALQALITQNAGPTEPNPTYAFQPWADTTTGILKQRNAANNEWIEILYLDTGRPVGAVAQTSPTGALLLAEGTDTQRPAPEDIPAGVAAVRGNSTSLTDYFLELWDRKTEVWDAIASRPWVKAITDALTNRVSNLESDIGFAIIYPNGGTAVAPANASINTRYVENNPFPTHYVACKAEIFLSGAWVETGWFATSSTLAAGVRAEQLGDGQIVIRTAVASLIAGGQISGSPADYTSTANYTTPSPVRVKVWKVGRINP